MQAITQRVRLSLIVMLTATLIATLHAQAQFVSFSDFLTDTALVNSSNYVGRPGYMVQDLPTFQQMQQYVLKMYDGVQVSQSFLLYSQYFDCVPIQQQPSYVQLGLTSIAQPPPALNAESGADSFSAQLGPGDQYDPFGNSTTCGEGAIPMRRITLDELSTYATLLDFFSKSPDGGGQLPGSGAPAAGHKYSYTQQTVDNLGGNSALNLWKPFVDTNLGQIFSLSQQWYSGGTGNNLQTVEGGWQNYPAKYGDENSRLFIFWTADNYQNLKCYNLDCPAFVQVNRNWHLGGKFSNYSISGGAQYYFTMTWYLFQGNWWLALGNDTNRTWVGYYPGQIFRRGQMSRNAESITYGGETAGNGSWGPMGSGAWAARGYKFAAYQRQIYYVDLRNNSQWANLTAQQPSPNCYTVSGPNVGGNVVWGAYFFFGGPGGNNC